MIKRHKILFIGLDNVLISTLGGGPIPNGIWDMKLDMWTLAAIAHMSPEYVIIVSNQNLSIDEILSQRFNSKMEYIENCISEYCNIPHNFFGENKIFRICFPTDSKEAKPGTYMLESGLDHFGLLSADKSDMLLVGDYIDKETAENFGIDYMDTPTFKHTITCKYEKL